MGAWSINVIGLSLNAMFLNGSAEKWSDDNVVFNGAEFAVYELTVSPAKIKRDYEME